MLMAIIGINGKMGSKLYEYYKNSFDICGVDLYPKDDVLIYKSLSDIKDKIDVVVDFSDCSLYSGLEYAVDNKILTLSGTTGYEYSQIEKLKAKGDDLFYWSANYSKGISLFTDIIKEVNEKYNLFDFIEIHASTKKDSPSGTAKMLADALNIGYENIQSLRLLHAPAIHQLMFSSNDEMIIIRHEVISSHAFLEGFDTKLKEMMNSDI